MEKVFKKESNQQGVILKKGDPLFEEEKLKQVTS
jgi:hypothetical protein